MSMQKGKQHPNTNPGPNYASRYQSYSHQQLQQREHNNYSHQLNAQTFATPGQTGVQQTAPPGPGVQNNPQVSAGANQPDGPRTPWRTSAPVNQQPSQSAPPGPPPQVVSSNPAGPVPNTPGGPPPNPQTQPTGVPGGTGGLLHHPLVPPPPQAGGSQPQPNPVPPTSTPPADHHSGKPPQCGPPPPTPHMSGQIPISYMNQPRPTYSQHFRQGTPRMPGHRNQIATTIHGNNVGQTYISPPLNYSLQSFMPQPPTIALQYPQFLPNFSFSNQQRQQNHHNYYQATASATPPNLMLNSQNIYPYQNNQLYYNVAQRPAAPAVTGQQVQQGAQTQSLPLIQQHPMQLSMVTMPMQPVSTGQQPQTQTQKNKRQRRTHAVDIVDPKTMQDITPELFDNKESSPPRSGESSARETPQPNNTTSNSDVIAQFAAFVYKVANEENGPVTTTQTSTGSVMATTTTVAHTITTTTIVSCTSTLISPSVTTTANISSMSIEAPSNLTDNLDSVSSEVEISQPSKINLNENSNSGSTLWKKPDKSVELTPVVSANTNAPAVHVKKMNTSDSSQIKASNIKNVKPTINQSSNNLSQDKGKIKDEKEKSPPVDLTKNIQPSANQNKHTAKGRKEKTSKSKDRDRPSAAPGSNAPSNETLSCNTGAIPREIPLSNIASNESCRFVPAGYLDGLVKPSPSKDSIPTSGFTTTKAENNALPVEFSPLPDLSNVQPAETTHSQADEKEKEEEAVYISSSSSTNSSDDESSNKKKSKRGSQVGSTNTSVSTTTSKSVEPELSDSATPTIDQLGEPSPPVSANQAPTIMKDLSSIEDEKYLEVKTSNNIPSQIEDKNSNISNSISNSSSRPESPTIQNNNFEQKLAVVPNMFLKANESSENDEKEKLDNKNDINTETTETTNHLTETKTEPSVPVVNKTEPTPRSNLKYSQDQWSPVNPLGKKKYGRDFLLELMNDPESKKKPDNLPDLDVVMNSTRDWTSQQRTFDRISNIRNQHDLLAPTFLRSGNNARPQTLSKRNSQQGKPNKGGKQNLIQFSISLKEDVKLHESDNAWKPGRFKGTSIPNVDNEIQKTDDLYKRVRGVLNKLTPQKFDTLVNQVKELPIDNSQRLKGVIDLVFDKAVDEPSFSVAYAAMCKVLQNMAVPNSSNTKPGEKVETGNFRKILINRCQEEFEKNKEAEIDKDKKLEEIKNCVDPEKKKELQLQFDEDWRKIRMKSLGNIRFIGELYKLSMLTVNIMIRCIKHLLSGGDEESLECLCKLLTTIGKDLESKSNNNYQDLGPYIDQMKQLANRRGEISSRVRFMVQDVEELRLNKWVPRRDESNPKTIDQIQKEADRERETIETLNLNTMNTPRKDDRLQDRRKLKNEEWQSVSSRRPAPFELTKIKQLKQGSLDTHLELGYKGKFSQWGRGASTKTDEKKSASFNSNKFAALDTSDDKRSSDLMRSSNTLGLDVESERKRMLSSHKNEARATPPVSRSNSRDNSSSSHRDAHNSIPFSNVGISPSVTSSSGVGQTSNITPTTRPIIPPNTSHNLNSTSGLLKAPVKLDENQLKLHTSNILDEYLSNDNLKELSDNVLEELIEEQRSEFVNILLNLGIERSVNVRESISKMLIHLVSNDILKVDDILNGFMDIFEIAKDIIIDVPKFWNFAADFLAPLITSKSISWAQFRDAIKMKDIDCSKLLPHLFQIIVKTQNPATIRQEMESQNVEIKDFISGEDVAKYMKENLEYLVTSTTNNSSLTRDVTESEIITKIKQLLRDETPRAVLDAFSDWANINVGAGVKKPAFIRALTTAICDVSLTRSPNSIKLNQDCFNSLNILLTKYIDSNPTLELQCIYAIQAFVNKLEHPPSLLNDIFSQLWDGSIISNEAFFQWELSQDPAEKLGKAVAVKSVVPLFISMRETEESDEDCS